MIKKIISKVGARHKDEKETKPEIKEEESKSDSYMMKNYMLSGGKPPHC